MEDTASMHWSCPTTGASRVPRGTWLAPQGARPALATSPRGHIQRRAWPMPAVSCRGRVPHLRVQHPLQGSQGHSAPHKAPGPGGTASLHCSSTDPLGGPPRLYTSYFLAALWYTAYFQAWAGACLARNASPPAQAGVTGPLPRETG